MVLDHHAKNRWGILAAFSSVALISQMLWLNFAPILTQIQEKFGKDEATASLLILVFPLLYVVLSIPSGILIDRKGYRFSAALGAVIQAAFSFLRLFDSFEAMLVGQIGIAFAQPFIVNGISKLASDRFDEDQGAIANGIGTMGMFIGMALALALTPILVEKFDLRSAMFFFSGISVLSTVIYLLVDKGTGLTSESSSVTGSFGMLLKDKYLLLLFALAFIGLGFFNGLTTWLEKILQPAGIGPVDAGLIGGALICGGIAGSAVIPALSDKFRRRKPFVLSCLVFALAITYPLCTGGNFTVLVIEGALLGFFFLPAFALLPEMCSELAGEKHTGAATGLLMMAGNAGGVFVILSMEWVKGDAPSFYPAVLLLMALLGAAFIGAVISRETYGYKSPYE